MFLFKESTSWTRLSLLIIIYMNKSREDKQEIIIIPFHRCVNNVPPTEQSSLCRVLGSCPKNYTKTKLICMSAVCCRTLIKRCAVANKEQCQSNGAGDRGYACRQVTQKNWKEISLQIVSSCKWCVSKGLDVGCTENVQCGLGLGIKLVNGDGNTWNVTGGMMTTFVWIIINLTEQHLLE